ncbi:MAG: hypothetical protein JXR49_15945 [Acidobacteria bacterium]|nr:hypothetical protein [Acidobacteriota bacterium]
MTRKYLVLLGLFILLASIGLFLFKRGNREGSSQQAAISSQVEYTNVPESQNNGPGLENRQMLQKKYDMRGGKLLEEWLLYRFMSDENMQHGGLSTPELIDILHKDRRGTRDFYARAQQILVDPSVELATRQELIFILTRAATPEAVRLIAVLIKTGTPDELKNELYNAISSTGEYFWDSGDLSQTSDSLLMLLPEVTDPDLLNALAKAIGNTGNAAGLNFFLDVISNQEGTLEDLHNSDDPLTNAALFALERVHDYDSAPTIAARLMDSSNNAEMTICANILASMQDTVGARYLLSWAQNADVSSTPIIQQAFGRISTPGLDYINSLDIRNLNFRSYQIKDAVLSSLGIQ